MVGALGRWIVGRDSLYVDKFVCLWVDRVSKTVLQTQKQLNTATTIAVTARSQVRATKQPHVMTCEILYEVNLFCCSHAYEIASLSSLRSKDE